MSDVTRDNPVRIEDRAVGGPHGQVPVRPYLPRQPIGGLVRARENGTLHGHLDGPDQPGAIPGVERIAQWLTCAPVSAVQR